LLITAVVVENRSVAESPPPTASPARGCMSCWPAIGARVRPRSRPRFRRPRSAPTALAAEAVELIAELRAKLTATGVDAGPDTIRWHLAGHWFCQVGERACGFLLPMTELLVSVAGVRVGVRALGAHADLCDLTVGVGQLASFGLPVMAKDPGAKLEAA